MTSPLHSYDAATRLRFCAMLVGEPLRSAFYALADADDRRRTRWWHRWIPPMSREYDEARAAMVRAFQGDAWVSGRHGEELIEWTGTFR